jgi:hypothetical protein
MALTYSSYQPLGIPVGHRRLVNLSRVLRAFDPVAYRSPVLTLSVTVAANVSSIQVKWLRNIRLNVRTEERQAGG